MFPFLGGAISMSQTSLLRRLFTLVRRRGLRAAGKLVGPPSSPPPTDYAPLPPIAGLASLVPAREGSVLCASPAGLHHMRYVEWGDLDNPRVLICVHGLTRNARDFDFIARALAKDYRVVCPDVVGRGRSDWLRDKALYSIPQYVSDMVTLIARLGVEQVDWIGTSMGGLIGMTLAAQQGSPIRRLVLNDVGPLLAASALQRIATYVGRHHHFSTLAAAEVHIRKVHAPFGLLTDEQWQHLTRWSVKPAPESEGGGFVYHYDSGIGDVFRGAPMLMDVNLWPIFEQIACPVLALRGGDSDLITHATLEEMTRRGPKAQIIEFPGIGHAPTLMSDAQITPVRDFLAAP